MRKKTLFRFILFCAILLAVIGKGYAEEIPFQFHLALSQSSRIQWGPNSSQISPGISVLADFCWPEFTLEGVIHGGLLIGFDVTASIRGFHEFDIGTWKPCAGFSTSLGFGPGVYHTTNIEDFIYPASPLWLAGIMLCPLKFDYETWSFSIFDIVIETDMRYLFRVFSFDITLVRFSLKFS